jgi:hypothetical protein
MLLFAAALLVRCAVLRRFAFDGLYGQDPFAYLGYSLDLKHALGAGQAPPPFFWPIGYPLLVAAAMALVGEGPAAAQAVSVLAGSLIAPLAYALVRAVRPDARDGAIVAGLLAVTAPQLVVSSLSVMSDAVALAWITLSAWVLLRYTRSLAPGADDTSAGSRLSQAELAVAAFTCAMAMATRWAAALAAIVWVAATLVAWRETRLPWRRRLLGGALAIAVVGVVFAGQFAGDWLRGELSHIGDFHVAGWDPRNALRSTVTNSDGTFHYTRPVGVFYAEPLCHPSFVFPLLSPFLLLGVLALRRSASSLQVLLLGWPLLSYLYLSGRTWENPRFSLGFFPPLLVWFGLGFSRARRGPDWMRRGAPLVATIGLLASLGWAARSSARFITVANAHLTSARWVEEATPRGAVVLSFGLTETLRYYTAREVVNLWDLDTPALRNLAADTATVFLVVDPRNIDEQWRDKRPALLLRWLRRHTTLVEVGRRSPWTLYAVRQRTGAAEE